MSHRIAWGRVGVASLVLILATGRWSSHLRAQPATGRDTTVQRDTELYRADERPSDPAATVTAASRDENVPWQNVAETGAESYGGEGHSDVGTTPLTAPQSTMPGTASGQQSPYHPPLTLDPRALPAGIPVRTVQKARVVVESHLEPYSSESMARFQRQEQLNEAIRRADSDKARQELAAELKQLVAATFDEDLAAREAELAQLEARVQALRAKQEQRKQNRDRIIQVHVDAVLLDAEGLSVPGMRVPLRAYGSRYPSSGGVPPYQNPPPILQRPDIPASNQPLHYTDPTTGETFQFGQPPATSY